MRRNSNSSLVFQFVVLFQVLQPSLVVSLIAVVLSLQSRKASDPQMGRKRKRGQAATQRWGSTSSRKQKKKRKTRGQGFKQANVPKEVDSLHIQPSNSTNCKMSSCIEIPSGFADGSLQRAKFWGINAIFSRLKTLASFCQHSTVKCFMSIRSVFLLLNWLKQTFGCGFQTLGKFLLAEKGHLTLSDRTTHLEERVKRMEALEDEVKSLKSELVKKTTCPCGDRCNRYMSSSVTQVGCLPQSLPLRILPPPPPPPPPPPVLPAAAPPLAFLKNKQPVSKASTSKETKIKSSTTLVTLEDLKKVKLRKVKQVDEKDKENAEPESKTTSNKFNRQKDVQCVVTLRDLKNVTLKRSKAENELEKLKLRTPEEMVVMRRNLRKVNITRSPGGTPLVSDKIHEHGTGLTPMMTKALKKKFQHAHPYSSPDSPSYQKKRQSLSPLTGSPNSRSPLSFR